MNLLKIRDKLTYIQRFLIFGLLYLISNLINGIDPEASLGIIQIFGGFLMGPLLLVTIYILISPLLFFILRMGDNKLKVFHNTNITFSTIIFDLTIIYLFASIFIPGLFYE